MRQIIYLNKEMEKYGLTPSGGDQRSSDVWHRKTLCHEYTSKEGYTKYKIVEYFSRGHKHSVSEVRLYVDDKFVQTKSYKDVFRYFDELLARSIMEE